MTPEELANEVQAVIEECRERVEGVGAQQYYVEGQPQKFETMPLDGLFEYAEEEIRDLIVYGVMTRIRLRRLREAVMAHVSESGALVTKTLQPRESIETTRVWNGYSGPRER
jgi:hypothetical protein